MAPMGCILFLHSNSTYFAKSVLLTLASHRGEMRKPVYCPSDMPMKSEYLQASKKSVINTAFSGNGLSCFWNTNGIGTLISV